MRWKSENRAVGWRPVGSLNASMISADTPIRITREQVPTDKENPQSSFVDRIFLHNGDAVPCKIHTIDESHVRVDMPLTDNNLIDREKVSAIEFDTFADATSMGFADPQWVVTEVKEKAAVRDDNKVVVREAAIIGYANIRDATEISFDVEWDLTAHSIITVALFTNSPKETSGNPSLLLYHTNGQQVMIQAMQGGLVGGMGNVRAATNVRMNNGPSFVSTQVEKRPDSCLRE